jgi:3',5'-nucleoside bisphosphate phosphatase
MIIEMHCHTMEHSSCSQVAAAQLAQACFEKGLQGLVLTDHHYLWPREEIIALRRQLAVPDFFLILAGQETTTSDSGDILVYGAPETIPRSTPLSEIRRRFPQAALIWAHPYRHDRHPAASRLLDNRLDGVEIFNSNQTTAENNRGLQDWHRHRFTAIAGTDTHAESYTATYPTIFDHPVGTVDELAAEIRHGRCRPFFTEIPRAGTTNTVVTEIGIGTDGEGRVRETIVIKTHENAAAWQSAERTSHVMEEIASCGFESGSFRIPRPLGHDPATLTTIEQGIRGKTLFDRMVTADVKEARHCLKLAAQWLARLHNCRLQATPPSLWLENEPKRLTRYLSALYRMNHPHTRKAQEIMDAVLDTEGALYASHPEKLIQGHGDYHPKNIFIGQDDPADRETFFVAAIDFDSSFSMPAAFDVGTFLAQFRNQFFNLREVQAKVEPELFLNTYLEASAGVDQDFSTQVELFKARTSLSIAYYLVKVGLGNSENLWRVLVEAEKSLTRISFYGAQAKNPVNE